MSTGPRERQRLAARWLGLAEEHLGLARHAFALSTAAPHRLIAFHAQQAAEAALKAHLVKRGIDFPYTHNLAHLLDLTRPWGDDLRAVEELTPFAVSARYDLDDEPVTEGEARRAVAIAGELLDRVKADCPPDEV